MLSAFMSFGAAFILALMPLGRRSHLFGTETIFAFFGALAVARALVPPDGCFGQMDKVAVDQGEETQ
jgi:hypothetical protein